MSTKKVIISCVTILAVAAAVTYFIFSSEPTAKSEGATKQMAMLVEVTAVEEGDYNPVFVATGTVQPVEDVILSPLVGGQVVRRSPAFIPGGFVQEGTVLLQIDPADYRYALELRRSELSEAETELEMEMGRQEVAEQDLELIGGDSLSNQQRSLVLRQPQLNAVRSRIQSARAAVDQAELNLQRSTIRAPFDAHILSQNVTLGSQVAPGDNLGRLVGTEFYWVELTVPVSTLRWLIFPDSEEEKGSEVRIRNTTAWPEDEFRTGFLAKQVGALDNETRLARVLVKVPDPLARDKEKPELMIGSFVEVRLVGEEIEDVVRVHRDYVRNNNTVWVKKDGKLTIKEVDILLKDADYAYVTNGLEDGDMVVTTNLSTVTEGIPLRLGGEEENVNQEEQKE